MYATSRFGQHVDHLARETPFRQGRSGATGRNLRTSSRDRELAVRGRALPLYASRLGAAPASRVTIYVVTMIFSLPAGWALPLSRKPIQGARFRLQRPRRFSMRFNGQSYGAPRWKDAPQ